MIKRKHIERILEKKKAEHNEDLVREKRNYGEIRPAEAQVGTKTWKSYSQIRIVSKAFRRGFEEIDWHA